jgi:antitoxin VapB
MGMNIKDEETHRLARRLARLTGENMTTAVNQALRARLKEIDAAKDDDFVERVLAIGRDCAAHLKEPYKSIDHGELLYDEKGLPK